MDDEILHVIVEQANPAGFPDYALTIFITVISGVLVFAFSEWLKEIWLTPLQNYKKIKAKVSLSLTMYACFYSNPVDIADFGNKLPENYEVASKELRLLASELRAFIETLSWCRIGIPKKSDIYEASANMIGLSNGMQVPYRQKDTSYTIRNNSLHEAKIKKCLRLFTYEVTTNETTI